MPVMLVSTAPSRDAYDAIDRLVDITGDRPSGLLVHSAAETADSTVLVVDVWESDAAMDAFERERLFPAFAAGGMADAMQAPPKRHSTFRLVRD
jgi:quinol monooxygenase YgiN